MDFLGSIINVVDIAMVIGIIVIIEALKKTGHVKAKYLPWLLIAFGFIAAYIKVYPFVVREFLTQGFIYSAACELIYRRWKDLMKGTKK